MIIGTGIDIIEVDRVISKINKNNGFREKVFSSNEITYCESGGSRDQHYAVRFAVKEAFLKATGGGLTFGYDLCDIEVLNGARGEPYIQLHGKYKTLADEQGWKKIHVSLSHLQSVACAMVIIEQ